MYAPFVEDSDDKLSQLAQLQVFLTLLSSLALRASPPSKLAGDLVTAVLFIVPCIGVALETPLLEVVGEAFGKLKGWLGGLIKLKPPALELEATTALGNVPSLADEGGGLAGVDILASEGWGLAGEELRQRGP
jgi:hypothetical protein